MENGVVWVVRRHPRSLNIRGGSRSRDWKGPYGERGVWAYNGVWGLCPQRGPGAEPLVRGSGGEALLKLNAFWCCHVWNGAKLLCLWAVLWSLMVAAVPACMRGSWVLIFHPWFGGRRAPLPPLDPPLLNIAPYEFLLAFYSTRSLSCTVSEILVKNRLYEPTSPLFEAPLGEIHSVRNFVDIFGIRKLESLDYRTA